MLSRYCWHWLILKFSSVCVCCQLQILSPVFGLQRPIDLISVFTQEIHLSTPVCTLTFTSAFKCHVDIDKSEIIDAICDICMHSVAGNIWDICLSYWFDVVYHGSDGTQWKLSERLMPAVSDCCSRLYKGIWSWKWKCSSAVQKWNVYDCVNNDLWSCVEGFRTACALFVSADGEWKTITRTQEVQVFSCTLTCVIMCVS